MKQFYITFICFYLLTIPKVLYSFLDVTPWLIIENSTDITLTCKIEVNVGTANDITMQSSSLNPVCQYEINQENNAPGCIGVSISFVTQPQSKIFFYPIFFCKDSPILPSISYLTLEPEKTNTHYAFVIHEALHRYIQILYSPYGKLGIIKNEIPLHAKISAFLHSLTNK